MMLYIYFLLGYFDDARFFFFFRLLIDTLLVEGLSMFPLKMCLRMVDSLSLSLSLVGACWHFLLMRLSSGATTWLWSLVLGHLR